MGDGQKTKQGKGNGVFGLAADKSVMVCWLGKPHLCGIHSGKTRIF